MPTSITPIGALLSDRWRRFQEAMAQQPPPVDSLTHSHWMECVKVSHRQPPPPHTYPAEPQLCVMDAGGMKMMALVTRQPVSAGTVVERFEGPRVGYQECSDYDKRYVLMHYVPDQGWVWMLPMSPARYANHACEPNCIINDALELVAARDLEPGTELTFLYNKGQEKDEWDPLWTFQYRCGSSQCQGWIDRYRDVAEPTLSDATRTITKHQRACELLAGPLAPVALTGEIIEH